MSSEYEDIPQFDDVEDLDTSKFDESQLEAVTTQSDADETTNIKETEEVAEQHSARDEIYDNISQWEGYADSDTSNGQTVESDLNVDKHLNVGGNAVINGSTLHKKDVLIEGWLVAPNIWKLKETVAKVLNDNPLYMVIDIEDGDSFITWGETKRIICRVFRGFTEETENVISWSIIRDSGVEQDDTAWRLKAKAKNFAGMIDICFNDDENDLGGTDANNSTTFTIVAKLAETESVTGELIY
jgi:hypothetical protein